MNGRAANNPKLFCARFTPTVSMIMMSVGISRITKSLVLNPALGESALMSVPSHLGGSTVSRPR